MPETVNKDNVSQEFHDYIDSKDHKYMEKVVLKHQGTVVITCREWSGCKYIADNYQDKKLRASNIYFTLFSEDNPSV